MVTQARRQPFPSLRGFPLPSLNTTLGLLLVLALLVWLAINLVKAPSDFVTVLLIGVTTGAIYALVALGYTLVYGILELINFAHGDVFMLGGMTSATIAGTWFGLHDGHTGIGVWLSVLAILMIAMAFCGTLN